MPPVPPSPVELCPEPRIIDDLELLRSGALQDPREVRLAGPGQTDIRVVDPEGVPLALVPADGLRDGALHEAPEWLSRLSPRPFETLYLSPGDVEKDRRTAVITQPLSASTLDEVEARQTQRLLVLSGPSSAPHSPGVVALRSAVMAATRLGIEVVAVPLEAAALRSRPGKASQVLHSYGVSMDDVLTPLKTTQPGGGTVLFFTGLSGSGKSTVARAVAHRVLETSDTPVTLLDGDLVRRHLSQGLGFSPADRETNIRRIGWVAAEIAYHGGLAICSPIAPYDATRREVRQMVTEAGGRMLLVHVSTPVTECELRDRKGLYARARTGEIPEFTGISAPYESPSDADLVIDTTTVSVTEARDAVLRLLDREVER